VCAREGGGGGGGAAKGMLVATREKDVADGDQPGVRERWTSG
jgi:hypothetical protein